MRKKEKILIERCIKDLIDKKGDHQRVIGTLCRMIGYLYPPYETRKNIKIVYVKDLLREMESENKNEN